MVSQCEEGGAPLPHPRFSNAEIDRRGQELYDRKISALVETEENIGKIIVIDIETGDYEIDSDGLAASHRAIAKHPGAALYGLRIGYDAVEGIGGGPEPIKR
jgi:hypothetical protein